MEVHGRGLETWQHIGLEDSRHVGAIWVDPRNPDVVFVAALGHTFAPNTERGVFKTTDGGKTWQKVLYKDDKTGAIDVAFAPDNPKIGFAALWYHYVNPDTPFAGLLGTGGAGIYKTTDGGDTWNEVKIPQLANAHTSDAHWCGGRRQWPARVRDCFREERRRPVSLR